MSIDQPIDKQAHTSIYIKIVVVTQRRFHAHFQMQWAPSFKKIHYFITSLMMMAQCWRGNVAGLHLCILQRTLTLLEWGCKEAPVNQQASCNTTRDIQTIDGMNIEVI
jgi:hypothetical protein